MSCVSTISEISGVNNAVQHLLELGKRMKDDTGFHDDDVANIDKIISSIQDLESEREKAHERLETETIRASILRHKLKFFPDEIKKEIDVAVKAARDSNAAQLQSLQNQLNAILESVKVQEARLEEIEKENAVLHPERDKVRAEHEEIIAKLNSRLAEKASRQISLNETRDRLRETNQTIVELEEGIVMLKEDLLQERLEHRAEKKRLKDDIAGTKKQTEEQRSTNVDKKKELDKLQDLLVDTGQSIDILNQSLQRCEQSKFNLEMQEKAQLTALDNKIKQNHNLKARGKEIVRLTAKNREDHENQKKEKWEKINKLVGDTEDQREKGEILEERKQKIEEEFKAVMEVQKKDKSRVSELNETLQTAKEALALKAEDCGRLMQENIDMDERTLELAETHKAVVSSLNKQIEEAREQLAKERKDRMDIQSQRESVQKDVDDFRAEFQKYANKMTKRIKDGKALYDKLMSEYTQLDKSIKTAETNTEKLKRDIKKGKKDYESMNKKLSEEIAKLEDEVAMSEKTLNEKKEILGVKEPEIAQLEIDFEEKTVNYDQMKRNVAGLKNKKNALDDGTKTVTRDIEKLVNPYGELEKELKKKREISMGQIKEHADERTVVEKQIYSVGCRLKTVLEENDRFMSGNSKLENEIENLKKQTEENIAMKGQLHQIVKKLKDELMKNWLEDVALEESFADRDSAIVEEIGVLLSKTEEREKQVSEISGKLQEELFLLTTFLDNVTTKRPKETRETKTGGATATTLPISKSTSKARKDAIDTVADANNIPLTGRSGPSDPLRTSRMKVPKPPSTQRGISKESTRVSGTRASTKMSVSSPRK